jgi:hypothetical protein
VPCYSPLKGFVDPESGGLTFRRENAKPGDGMEVACGQCLGCRLDRSRTWAMRITHEASLHESNSFVTLTYRPKEHCTKEQLEKGYHLPEDWSLNKKHFQDFMKRLRKHFKGRSIKYYHAGEYGTICEHGLDLEKQKCPLCNLGRPHYHACIFNLGFTDLEPYSQFGETVRYTSPTLEKIWKFGFVDVGKVEFQSAAYVARYIMKKITGEQAEEHYQKITTSGELLSLQPEYATMSNGIGKEFYKKYKNDFFPSDEVPVPGTGVIKKMPRYYDELLKKENESMLEEVKENRKLFRKENAAEYTSERLMSKYKVKKVATTNLSRNKAK